VRCWSSSVIAPWPAHLRAGLLLSALVFTSQLVSRSGTATLQLLLCARGCAPSPHAAFFRASQFDGAVSSLFAMSFALRWLLARSQSTLYVKWRGITRKLHWLTRCSKARTGSVGLLAYLAPPSGAVLVTHRPHPRAFAQLDFLGIDVPPEKGCKTEENLRLDQCRRGALRTPLTNCAGCRPGTLPPAPRAAP